ncbi:MAG: hypothetical protein ACOYB1_02945, partial [Limnohabitans sp.]
SGMFSLTKSGGLLQSFLNALLALGNLATLFPQPTGFDINKAYAIHLEVNSSLMNTLNGMAFLNHQVLVDSFAEFSQSWGCCASQGIFELCNGIFIGHITVHSHQ